MFSQGTRTLATLVSATILSAIASIGLNAPADADVSGNKCGAPLYSLLKDGVNAPFTTSSSSLVNIPGAKVNVNVPAGEVRCIRIRFSAVISCAGTDVSCFVRPNFPTPFAPKAYTSSDKFAAHSYEWFNRVVAGSYPIQMQVDTGGTSVTVATWNLSVDVTQ